MEGVLRKWRRRRYTARWDAVTFNGETPSLLCRTHRATSSGASGMTSMLGMFMDQYLLAFIKVEEIGKYDKTDVDEKVEAAYC